MKNEGFDVERELRANRPEPRGEYTRSLADEVRSHEPTRTRAGRFGLALALSGLTVVAVASFGGIGYASSSASHAAKPAAAKHIRIVHSSAAHAQYAPVTPPKHKAGFKPKTKIKVVKAKHASAAAAAVKVQKSPSATTTSQLPFTGLALWVPLAIGLMLIAVGIVLRTRGRRGHRGAH
jgi:hypothetical protein